VNPQVTYPLARWNPDRGRSQVKTARRYRTIQIQAGDHVITAADPLPGELRQAIEAINASR
jgi:hypothetical protein